MFPHIAHLYGPVWIESYGFMIAVGLLAFLYLSLRHPLRKQLISRELYVNGVFFGLLCGVLGGRTLYALSYPHEFIGRWHEFFYPWIGGLTVIGAIASVALGGAWYLKKHAVPVLPILDVVALYGPLMQAIARLGCLAAGCCYGALAPTLWWAVTFTDPAAHAPLYTPLHPAQLYASLASAAIFVVLLLLQHRLMRVPGLTVCLYLALENAARFIVDFWRGDRDPIALWLGDTAISQVQLYALVGLACALSFFIWLLNRKRT